MALEIVAATRGLWRDPQWTPGMPGVYALIAGASAYPHLAGGSAAAAETHGLGQLVSSAHTAAGLFRWLRDGFHRDGLPVVWCWLLLAPSADEKTRLDALGLTHYAEPDNATLRLAIQHWTGQVPKLAPAAARSRTLFFFSGHGVQSNWNALLLPSDYLDPAFGAPQLENCISAAELRKWMEESPVAEHLALIDACRNEFSPLASKGAAAHGAFPVNPPGGAVPRAAATLAATSPNTVAYQLPGRDFTFFGQAVLEVLNGLAEVDGPRLEFRELVDYVKPRVNALLQEVAGTGLDQTVRQRIDGDDELVVTDLPPPAAAALATGGPAPGRPRRSRGARPPAGERMAQARAALASRFDAALRVADPISLAQMQADFGQAHRRMGHEHATFPWMGDGVALYALADGSRLQGGIDVMAVERDIDSQVVQVDLRLGGRAQGVLLVFEGAPHVQRERLALALPTDQNGPLPVRLTLTLAPGEPGGWTRIQKVEGRLGPCDWHPHYEYLWQLTSEADLGSLRQAAAKADPQRLQQAAQDKLDGQTAATAGMLLLARAGQIARVHDWTRNLMHGFPWLPDGAVLWAESLRDAVARGEAQPWGVADPAAEMAAALASLLDRGLPLFADTLELADGLLRHCLRGALPDDRREQLQAVAQWIERAYQVAMPGGHFLVLAGLPRPPWLPAGQAFGVAEMIAFLRHGG